MIHQKAECLTPNIGAGTYVWQFSIVREGAILGEDCNVCSHCLISDSVVIGDRVTIKNGVAIPAGVMIGNDAFIGPNVTFANPLPADGVEHIFGLSTATRTVIGTGASIGGGAVVQKGVTIGDNALVGAGAVVTLSVPPNAIVVGNPARIVGYANQPEPTKSAVESCPNGIPLGATPTEVSGVVLYRLPIVKDLRGDLTVGEFEKTLPFRPMRYFMVVDVPSRETRGEHAHRECTEFLICVTGSCTVVADDGRNRQSFQLDSFDRGLLLPPGVWRTHFNYSPDAILLVFASHHYDPSDYIRDYDQFRAEVGAVA
ncbi:WxcM-like domain-containing protein [Chthonobacter albigriseus]|uniref:WxcM-like domain-containing protein n=1 Tax=Chthonobacter albigriseus TaxID=1683161 RepID=UPI0015EF161D|nr:WxcM-like domain-containing protein [Chthonobacter albigriseus]